MNVIAGIKNWQIERQLDKQGYSWGNEAVNDLEETMEALGYDVPKEKRQAIREEFEYFVSFIAGKYELKQKTPTLEDTVDAHCDKIVFNTGAILKLGFDPVCALQETLKEISSRTGSIVNGKFQKDKSPEAVAKWYKANYKKCLIKNAKENK